MPTPIRMLLLAGTLLAMAGCERPSTPKSAPAPARPTVATTSPAVKALCPVCSFAVPEGMEVEVTDKTASAQYKGKTYYFCSDNCKTIFDKDPARYVSKMNERK